MGVQWISRFTLVGIGYSDASDAFVCLSGISFGMAYSKRLTRDGLLRSTWHAAVRSFQLLMVFWLACGVIAAACNFIPSPPTMLLAAARGRPTLDVPFIWQVITLQYQPFGLSILVLYGVLLPIMPLWLWTWRREPVLALGLSLWIYLLGQWQTVSGVGVWIFTPNVEFNPLGWQLLYCVSAVVGAGWFVVSKPAGEPTSNRHPYHHHLAGFRPAIPLVAGTTLLAVAALRLLPEFCDVHSLSIAPQIRPWTATVPPWGGRSAWQPIRALHFANVVAVTCFGIKSMEKYFLKGNGGWLGHVGQNSLRYYLGGLMFAYLNAASGTARPN